MTDINEVRAALLQLVRCNLDSTRSALGGAYGFRLSRQDMREVVLSCRVILECVENATIERANKAAIQDDPVAQDAWQRFRYGGWTCPPPRHHRRKRAALQAEVDELYRSDRAP